MTLNTITLIVLVLIVLVLLAFFLTKGFKTFDRGPGVCDNTRGACRTNCNPGEFIVPYKCATTGQICCTSNPVG